MDEPKKKRKTHTSNEVVLRYTKKTYQQYSVKLRKVEDAALIKLIEDEKAKGFETSTAFKNLLRQVAEKNIQIH